VLRLGAHLGTPGPAPFVAYGLFLAAIAAGVGAYRLYRSTGRRARTAGIGLAALSAVLFAIATAVPFIIHAPIGRPSTSARLEFVSPRPGEVFTGDPALVPVRLRLEGGRITPVTSVRLIPNTGHVHLYLDGALVSMIGAITARVSATPGRHVLTAEFVAVDHAPFDPRVVATVSFDVRGGT